MTAKKRSALGRGLDSLLGTSTPVPVVPAPGPSVAEVVQRDDQQSSMRRISVGEIKPNRHQPRQDFDQEALEDLAKSIEQSGLIQPLVVRQVGSTYELVAGERRLRAAKLAGLDQVPCVIADVGDNQSLLMALVENIQRENLNPIEEAEAFLHLREELRLSQEEVAERVGKSRVAVANSLRLLNLPEEIKEDVRDGAISAGHARALLGVPEPSLQRKLWNEIKAKQLSVREAEERCRATGGRRPRQTSAFTGRPAGDRDIEVEALEERLMNLLGCKVSIQQRGDTKGRVMLHYASLEEFDRILEILGMPVRDRL